MKTKHLLQIIQPTLLLLFATIASLPSAWAQGTAFTYQGQLSSGANPVSGSYDLTFTLLNAGTNGNLINGPLTNSAVAVSNGLFTTTLDFGASFPGLDRWLQIGVRTNGNGAFAMLNPLQHITPTPYAITAENLASVVELNSISPFYATVAGGEGNNSSGAWSSVVGGEFNKSTDQYASVGGGFANSSLSEYATVAGGYYNTSTNLAATVSGGYLNTASASYATVSGGENNIASGIASVVAGGASNTNSGNFATICGGANNLALGFASTVCGGDANIAEGSYSFAAGNSAEAYWDGDFVWADDIGGTVAATGVNQFVVRASGGFNLNGGAGGFNVTTTGGATITAGSGITLAGDMHMGTSSADYHHFSIGGGNSYGYLYGSFPGLADGVDMGYNYYVDASGAGHIINGSGGTSRIDAGYGEITLFVGGVNTGPTGNANLKVDVTTAGVTLYGTVNNVSDRNAKQDFAPISPAQILDKVLQLPVSEWSYKTDTDTRHIGPVAQDFYSVFNIGTDDKHIAPIDEGGVALAAIQGLNQKLNAKDADIQKLQDQNQSLAKRLAELEQAVRSLTEKK